MVARFSLGLHHLASVCLTARRRGSVYLISVSLSNSAGLRLVQPPFTSVYLSWPRPAFERAGPSLVAPPSQPRPAFRPAPPRVPPGFRREGRGVGWLSRWLRRGRGRHLRRRPARSPPSPLPSPQSPGPLRSQDCRSRACDARDAGPGRRAAGIAEERTREAERPCGRRGGEGCWRAGPEPRAQARAPDPRTRWAPGTAAGGRGPALTCILPTPSPERARRGTETGKSC